MSITKHNDSHLDHNLTDAQVEFILGLPAKEGEVTVQTVELPEELGTVPCGLFGPCMGDAPVTDAEVTLEVRGDRKGPSRLVDREPRQVRTVTVISGPHDGNPCVLFTAFGGPSAPKEPWDFPPESNRDDFKSLDVIQSEAFWSEHALAK